MVDRSDLDRLLERCGRCGKCIACKDGERLLKLAESPGDGRLERVKERVTWPQVFALCEVTVTSRNGKHSGNCPFCGDKKRQFHADDDRKFFKTFCCGKGGDTPKFVMLALGVSFHEALDRLEAIE